MQLVLLFLYSTGALAHPGHGQPDFLHGHGEWLLIVGLVAVYIGWKILRKP